MVIRVRIANEQQQQQQQQEQQQQQPPVKRSRTAKGKNADRFTDIAAHANVLCSHSLYFEKCMGGDWAESAGRRV